MQRNSDLLRWPDGVSGYIDIPSDTLIRRRTEGDAPRLYAIGRALFTTTADVIAWVTDHEVAPGFRVRPPTRGKRAEAA